MSLPSSEQLIAFLNALPTTPDSRQWNGEFQTALEALFPEIDYQIFAYNMLDEKHRDSVLNDANMRISEDQSAKLGFSAQSQPPWLRERLEGALEADLAARGETPDQYHPPTILSYHDSGWLGSLILLRKADRPPFSEHMLSTLAELQPFFIFVFKDHSMRYHAEHPADSVFFDAVLQITEQMGLTMQEMRVLMFRLLGQSYKEISEMLGIAQSTVKNHLNAVHTKAGVHTQSELFARYFAPRFGLFSRLGGKAEPEDGSSNGN
jgi:DNA-binding CsgD family transcriptional regulator